DGSELNLIVCALIPSLTIKAPRLKLSSLKIQMANGEQLTEEWARMNLFKICTTLFFAIFATAAAAQYPSKPIRVVVPYAAGGGNDIIARIVTQKISENTGKTFVIENRVGAGGLIGYEFATNAPGDGYTLSASDTGYNILTSLYGANVPWDKAK